MPKPNQKDSPHNPSDTEDRASTEIDTPLNWTPKKPLPKWKIALFSSVILFLFPVLFLLLLEGCFALAGTGVPTEFYLSSERKGEKVFVSNPYFIRPYFGPGVSRGCMPFIIPQQKPERTIRIFVLGASAAQGDPDPAYGISRQLEVMLQEQYPDHVMEVYNVAITAINSHVVLPIMRACADMDPDLFVLYLGNNEVVGPFGSGSVFASLVRYRWLISLQTRLKGSRFGQWASAHFKTGKGQPEAWLGMEMFLKHPVSQDDPRMQTVYQHYRNNLRSMFHIGIKHDVPVIISSVAVNLKDNAPFASQHKASLQKHTRERWEALYARGIKRQNRQQYAQALSLYQQALELDDQYAELHFRVAECSLKTGQIQRAKDAYSEARDLDVLRFRADSTINRIIQETAAEFEDVAFLDGKRIVEEHSPNGIPGTELFYEHVHYNFEGNYLMARTLNAAVLEALESERGAEFKSADVISESEMKKRLAYTRWDQLKIAQYNLERLENPPFTAQSDIAIQHAKLKQEVDDITSTFTDEVLREVLASYEYARKAAPHWFLYDHLADVHFSTTGNLRLAEEYYQKAMDEYPHSTLMLGPLAKVKLSLGNYEEAEALLRKSLAAVPADAQKKANLGVVLGSQGRFDEAIEMLREAVAATVYVESAYFNLAVYLFNRNANDPAHQAEALEYWHIVLENNPDHLEARYGVADIYHRQGRISQAIQELEKVLAKEPSHQSSRDLLEKLKKKPR